MRDEQAKAGRHAEQHDALRALEQYNHPPWLAHPLLRLLEGIGGELQGVGRDAGDTDQRRAIQDGKFRPEESRHGVASLLWGIDNHSQTGARLRAAMWDSPDRAGQ